ncbi:hypothetical protein GBF38_004150 [Nibea albiflora]|uniref:Uncharacterized protein n=1 Tax=Nibea albiflora TaxID=240163 RepID=A0ACB7FC07_NIBAL|nr:hypothetical protein GBF38_004150 [Nibea albiflora]
MRLYGVLLLLVTLSAEDIEKVKTSVLCPCIACGLKCYECDQSKSCTRTEECSPAMNRCGSVELNGLMKKGCVSSSQCGDYMKCCEGDLCNGAITTGSSVLLLLVSSAIITLFL